MKTILQFVKVVVLAILLFFHNGMVAAQDYLFTNYTSFTGTHLQEGASYLYTNVKPGVDARVVITALTGGVTLSNIDGSGGFTHALQPVISVPALSNGYVELRIDFFNAGTSVPSTQTEIPITPIDVDGQMYSGMPLYEFDEIELINGYTIYQMTGSQLTLTTNGGWVRGKNNAAIDYPGIDTSQKLVMFTTMNGGVNSIRIRVGADNMSSSSASRLRSVYFKRFTYSSAGILEVNPLKNFKGSVFNTKVQLQYELVDNSKIASLAIEKSTNSKDFVQLYETNEIKTLNQFEDPLFQSATFYRLKITRSSGAVYYSNLLRFEYGQTKKELKVYPTQVDDQLTVQVQSDNVSTINLLFVDYNGRIVLTRKQHLNKGHNAFRVDGLGALERGTYIILAKNETQTAQQKIIKQ